MKKVRLSHRTPYTLYLTVRSVKPIELVIMGYEKGMPKTVYFRRKYGDFKYTKPFQGTETIEVPVPIVPDNLQISLFNEVNQSSKGIRIVRYKIVPLKAPKSLNLRSDTREFIEFAKSFSKSAAYLRYGSYSSKNELFEIDLLRKIRDEDGSNIDTVASVYHNNGKILIKKDEFSRLTVSNRMMILLHEHAHFITGSEDEFVADREGLRMYLDQGFSKTEAIYTLHNLFVNDIIRRAEKEERVQMMFNQIKAA